MPPETRLPLAWFICLLGGTLLLTSDVLPRAQAGDVPWLAEVTTVPGSIPQPATPLRPLLRLDDGTEIRSLEEWALQRERLRKAWLKFLGPLPSAPSERNFKILQTEQLSNCMRQLVEYEPEKNRTVQAYLLTPISVTEKTRPALVVFHPTTTETIRSVAGLGTKPLQGIGLQLAEQGFVVICPANFLWEEPNYAKATEAVHRRHPQSRGMATMLADGMRAVDLLVSIPSVDPQRIGTIGHSLGAKEAMYLLAFDDRVQAGVASEGGLGLDSTNWDAEWYLGPKIKEPAFERNHHELLAMIAPRPFLTLGGESGRGCADGERSWPYIATAHNVSRLSGQPPRQGLLNHHEGHLFSASSIEKSIQWLQVYVAEK